MSDQWKPIEYPSWHTRGAYVKGIISFSEVNPSTKINTSSRASSPKIGKREKQRRDRILKQIELSLSRVPRSEGFPEKLHQIQLCEQLGGEMEVSAAFGQIDILTDTELIEVKHYYQWKSAVGQLLAYSQSYPDRIKRLHLFDVPNPRRLDPIRAFCDAFDIVVTAVYISQ
jgi:hypothetical protein